MAPSQRQDSTVAIVGAGRVGTALSLALRTSGYHITAVADRVPIRSRRCADRVGAPVATTDPAKAAHGAPAVIIATPDRVIAPVCREMVEKGGIESGMVVAHTSGAHGTELLDPARKVGAYLLSFHPLQTLTDLWSSPEKLAGIAYALGGDPRGIAWGRRAAIRLGGWPLVLPPEAKLLYHAAACVASNYVVSTFALAVEIFERSGIGRKEAEKALLPLFMGTVENLRLSRIPAALTGPVERGDVDTVRQELMELKTRAPDHAVLFALMGRWTVSVARQKGSLTRKQEEEFLELFNSFV
jgi:predicted short-subunit dehydrogenase-like oxidoreductase (DUF2520 family)